MSPTMERPARRVFKLQLNSGATASVAAETICEPNGGDSAHYVLKRGGEVVGKFHHQDVLGWWIEESSED